AGRTELRDDRVREIARAFRSAARQHDHVALDERTTHGGVELLLVVRERAEGDWLATRFSYRRGDDCAVRIIDRAGPERLARLRQFVAGREHGDLRFADDLNGGDAAGGEHADFARADQRAAAQECFAARNVGA